MASLKDIKNRIKSVRTIQRTTKALKMLSAAKLRKAQSVTIHLRPYAAKLNELLVRLVASLEGSDLQSPYASTDRPLHSVLVVVITSNRGQAGSFSAAITKLAVQTIQEKYPELAAGGKVQVLTIGRKGFEYFLRRPYPRLGDNHNLFEPSVSVERVNEVAERVMQGYLNGEWDRVELVYNEFKSLMAQTRRAETFLPIAVPKASAQQRTLDYIYEPAKEEILLSLIPLILKMRLYRAVLESNMAEHAARMFAMDNATENAQEILDALKLSYNKARQASITKEIIEIVSGAEALSGGG